MFETLLVNILMSFGILCTLSVGIFIIARITHDNSIMDIAYGPLFLMTALLLTYITNSTLSVTTGIILICIGVWATRLSIRIYLKNKGKPEDARYAAWRTAWLQHGRWYFWLRSFLQINLLQCVIIGVVLLPFTTSLSSNNSAAVSPLTFIGIAIAAFGFLYESLADWQLDIFLAGKKNGTVTAPLMVTGLFRYSRRPNYFGESLIWWGLAISVLSLPFGWLALLSPLLITYIVTFVTGPMLEKQFLAKYPNEYRAYIQSTSYFFPAKPRN